MKKLLILAAFIGAALYWNSNEGSDSRINTEEVALSELPEDGVVLFATEWCPMCQKTRELFEKHEVSYYEYDVEKSKIGKEEYKKISDSNGVPLVYFNGGHVLGFNESKILKLINET